MGVFLLLAGAKGKATPCAMRAAWSTSPMGWAKHPQDCKNAERVSRVAQLCRADVQTYCFGLEASMGAFLLGAGAKGKRYSMPNARIMIHQPLGGASGQAVDIEIQVSNIANLHQNVRFYCST